MNKLFTILGFIGAILGLIFGLIAYTSARKQNGKSSFQRIVVLLSLIAIIISVGKQLVFTDTVKEDVQFIEKTEQSKQDAVKELEELEEELNEDLDELE